MCVYYDKLCESEENPDELVEYEDIYDHGELFSVGTYLNGQYEGKSSWFYVDGSVGRICFYKSGILHGEYKRCNSEGEQIGHYFNINDFHAEELDYLINEERDETFYVTLALHGIDKEYTIGAE